VLEEVDRRGGTDELDRGIAEASTDRQLESRTIEVGGPTEIVNVDICEHMEGHV
jgi:hypothetical protein